SYTLEVFADTQPPLVTVTANTNPARIGESVTFLVQASDNVAIQSKTLSVAGKQTALDGSGRATVTFNQPGQIEVAAIATHTSGNPANATLTLQVIDPSNANAPKVFFTELRMRLPPGSATPYRSIPLQGPIVVTSFTDVFGTVQDGDLDYYTLS